VRVEEHYGRIRFHFEKVVFILPDERDILKLLDVIPRRLLDHLRSLIVIGQQEVVDQLFTPLDNASYNMER
jgi:hypothetical protein